MASAPEKVPLMTRLGRHLERHGLSFGDALNVLLFVLTIVSLLVAVLGVIVARITLDEARKAASDQDRQFQSQMEQLTKSSAALETATGNLKRQGDILERLQGTSDQQLANLKEQLRDLNAAEARIRARPRPFITAYCDSKDGSVHMLLDVSTDDIRRFQVSGYKNKSVTLPAGNRDELRCLVHVYNEGDGELKNVELRAQAWCSNTRVEQGLSNPVNLITKINQEANNESFGKLIAGRNVPPKSSSDRSLNTPFTIHYGVCTNFMVILDLEADNFPTSWFETEVTVQ